MSSTRIMAEYLLRKVEEPGRITRRDLLKCHKAYMTAAYGDEITKEHRDLLYEKINRIHDKYFKKARVRRGRR